MEIQLVHPIFELVSKAAEQLHREAYVVGGYVRDLLMDRPSKDIDIVCLGSGIDLAQACSLLIGESVHVTVFKNFGTAMLQYPYQGENWQIEFVGARKESYRAESRKPIVEQGTIEEDRNRRDFTINTLAISLQSSSYCLLIDPFDGAGDIRRKIIRTPLNPDITFSDDPLRMMRAIRFASQLNFEIEQETFQAIQRNKDRIRIVSMERNADELNKIMLSPKPSIGFILLYQSGLLEILFPELYAMRGVESHGEKSHKDNFFHTLEVVDNIALKSSSIWLRWAALLHDIGKPATKRYDAKIGFSFHGHEVYGARMVSRIFRRLKLPMNEKMKYVEKLVLLHLRPIVLAEDVVTDSAVRRMLFEAGDSIEDLMLLAEADITSKNSVKVRRYLRNFELVRMKLVELEEKDRVRNFQPPVSGEDIMQLFQMQPCREVGLLKAKIKEAILDGLIPNERERAIEYMYQEAEKMGMKSHKRT